MRYERDMRGYGANPPDPKWPGGAYVAVQFVVNYEEGGENCVLHGDKASEAFLSEIVGAAPWVGQRHWNMESIYEYGARAGFWRLYRLFTEAQVPVTCYGVATALARSPDQVVAMQEAGWEIASHGLKWIDYRDHDAEDERRDLEETIRLHYEVTGARPTGWYTGRTSVNTVRLVAEEGGFDYVSDTYDDELPYWFDRDGLEKPQLIIPYTLDANDMRFATPQGFNSGDQFFAYLKDSFDTLYAEGKAGRPRMMNIGLHCRLVGRPGRVAALKRFVDYVKSHDKVWLTRRIDIAKHWRETHPYQAPALRPSRMEFEEFVHAFGGVFEHSPWIAERAYELELGPAHD
ncbi:MAG: allantoinase PuuE, partial [Mesorhizobium sp.]